MAVLQLKVEPWNMNVLALANDRMSRYFKMFKQKKLPQYPQDLTWFKKKQVNEISKVDDSMPL